MQVHLTAWTTSPLQNSVQLFFRFSALDLGFDSALGFLSLLKLIFINFPLKCCWNLLHFTFPDSAAVVGISVAVLWKRTCFCFIVDPLVRYLLKLSTFFSRSIVILRIFLRFFIHECQDLHLHFICRKVFFGPTWRESYSYFRERRFACCSNSRLATSSTD